MRGACCLVFLLILLPLGQSALSSPSASATAVEARAELRISEVLPRFPFEHIGIVNSGSKEVELLGWSVTDGEGWWRFAESRILPAGKELILGPNATFISLLHPEALVVDPSTLSKKGRLALADEGDEVLLEDPHGNLADMVAYGKSTYSGIGWNGDRCPTPPEGKALRRDRLVAHCDSDSKEDWSIISMGRSSLAPVLASSMVEPFLCPDHMRTRVLREIAFAHVSIAIEVYIFSDPAIAEALASASQRGVKVRMLVEGEPVGGLSAYQQSCLQAICRYGCEVYQSHDYHGFKRYDYLHAKFMVVDGRRVLLASENFAPSSLDGNRGWGISIDDQKLAMAFLSVFERDVDPRYPDIHRLDASSATTTCLLDEPPPSEDASAPECFPAWVETVLAPDYGYAPVLSLIEEATERLYLELYYLGDQWSSGQDPYRSILDSARRGVSVRVILDGNWYNNEEGKGNTAIAQKMNDAAAQEGLDLEAKTLSPFHGLEALHNKGAIADEKVLVSSINWVRASFERNREVGAIIDSASVADYFAKAFLEDWVDDAISPELEVPSYVEVDQGRRVVLNATASDNSGQVRLLWDLGGDGSIDGEGLFFMAQLSPGESLIKVTALDPSNNSCTREVRVLVLAKQADEAPYYAAASLSLVAVVIWSLRKRVKRA